MEVKFDTDITVKDMYKFLLNNTYRRFTGVVWVIFTCVVIFVTIYTWGTMQITYSIILIVLALVYAANPVILYFKAKSQIKNTSSFQKPLSYVLDGEGIKISQDDAGILLTEVDNTKPFTLKGKVTSGFLTEGGLYNAATFFVYANDTLWQKLCFEHGDHGEHRIVSVRTIGTSDDNNHDVVDSAKSVYFKISSDTQSIASYFSLDGKEWQMVRIYKNQYPSKLYLGICSQAPQAEECTSTFEELSLTTDNVDDFRMGE